MKLAFHSATTMTSDLENDIAVAAGAGFRWLEVWAAKLDRYLSAHSLPELHELFRRHGLAPLALSSIEFIAFRGDDYPKIQARLNELGPIAQAIGCPTVVVVPSPLPDRSMPWGTVVDEYVRVLRDLSGIAKRYELQLTFEPLGFGWCSVRTPRAALEILRACNRDNLGLTVDAAHFYASGAPLGELEALDPEAIFGFHLDDLEDTPMEAITDATRLLPGLGIVPLQAICARLQHIGYDGPCSVETFRPEYWEWAPQEVAAQAHAAALKTLAPYFQVE
jgi:2-keto-myo-inositol isomerase